MPPPAPSRREAGQPIEGFLDAVAGDLVTGWAYDPASPERRLVVEVSVGGQVTVVVADVARADLAAAGKGDGRHGFVARLDIAAASEDPVRARVADGDQELHGSPLRTDLISALQGPGGRHLVDYLQAEAQNARHAAPNERSVNYESARPYATRARIEKLFAVADPEKDREGIISRYLEFEFHRFKLGATFLINGDLVERLKVLNWYLAGYGPHRNLPLPLSDRQIEFLNEPIPLIGFGVNVSIAAYSFIKNEGPGVAELTDEGACRKSLYWWALERSPKIAPHGELIPPAQISSLTSAGAVEIGKRYPLNFAVRRLQEVDGSLQFLNLDIALHRAVLVCILILRTVDRPYLAQFLPQGTVNELLRAENGVPPVFERMLAIALGGPSGDVTAASRLRTAIEERLDRAGLSLSRTKSIRRNPRGGTALSLVEEPAIARGLDPGVAVIGPVGAASGLGQATRLSLDVLDHAGLAPAVYDFGLDNPAPRGFSSAVKAQRLERPRQINLLHLNAESIPLAFAYIDCAVHDRSYNIGYFFWELDQIPKCHYLALDMLDEIWVSSEYNREIYERFATIPVRNVGMAVEHLPEAPPLSRNRFGLSADQYVFLATFDSFSFIERKNPLAVLAAFQKAFPRSSGENVRLILKTQNRSRVGDLHQVRVWRDIDSIVQGDDRIRIIDGTFSYRELLGLKKMCDCYVSLHRSEGWGFGLIEAMQLKMPVIATAYSGNMDFCTPENCFLVDYDLVSPMPWEYIFVERGSRWAEPSILTAAEHMRHVVLQPEEAKLRGEAAFSLVQREFSVASIARRYSTRLDEIHGFLTDPATRSIEHAQ